MSQLLKRISDLYQCLDQKQDQEQEYILSNNKDMILLYTKSFGHFVKITN